MLSDVIDSLGRNIDALAYIALIVMLVAVAIHADKRYDQERQRNIVLERRIRSLTLVTRFQDTLLKVAETDEPVADEPAGEVLDLSVDTMIRQLGYCLTCHRLKAPAHFNQTDHLRLEDENLGEMRQ